MVAAVVEPLRIGCGVIGDVDGREPALLGHSRDFGDRFSGYELIDRFDTMSRQFEGKEDGHEDPFIQRRAWPGAARGSPGRRKSADWPWRAGRTNGRRVPR